MSLKLSVVPVGTGTEFPADTAMPLPYAAPADVAKFQQALAGVGAGDSPDIVKGLLGGAKQASQDMQRRAANVEQALHRAQRSLDPVDLLKTSHLLASYGQEMAMTVRVINKATQSLDQLSKLQ